jgi:hypothetical protein
VPGATFDSRKIQPPAARAVALTGADPRARDFCGAWVMTARGRQIERAAGNRRQLDDFAAARWAAVTHAIEHADLWLLGQQRGSA